MTAESTAFTLSFRNFEPIPVEQREPWLSAFLAAKRLDDTPWPEKLIVELANTCNLDCPMCRVGKDGVDLSRVMPLDRFERLAAMAFPHVRQVRLNGLGESTLVPDFERYLDVIAGYPVTVELITNGTGQAATYRRMVGEGSFILFSWDAADPGLFEELRRPARWREVDATLRDVAGFARDGGKSDQLHLLFTLQPANHRELPALVRYASDVGVPSVIVNVMKQRTDEWARQHWGGIRRAFEAADGEARELGVRLHLPDLLGGQRVTLASAGPTSASGCDRPWKELVVRHNLDVQVCNMFNPYAYGNLAVHPFERVWRGGFSQAFRANVNTANCHPYCRGCAYLQTGGGGRGPTSPDA